MGNSRELPELVNFREPLFDFVFSCPPYYDLEVYSDDPADLSNLGSYSDFLVSYRDIIKTTSRYLKTDSFACFVVSDIRDEDGNYRGLPSDTIWAFEQAGLHLYNDIILLTAIGSLPIRAGKHFAAGRKVGKAHQNVLVFVKGDGKKAAQKCEQL